MIAKHEMRVFAEVISGHLPKGLGFALFVFDTGETVGEFEYISNARREDIAVALEGMLQSWKNSANG